MAAESESAKSRLHFIKSQPGNHICADCGISNPTWASVNHKCFICTPCSGVHRCLGVHISFVQSLGLDEWSMKNAEDMESGGNDACNAVFEYHVPPEFPKPIGARREEREAYIRAKYETRAFARDEDNLLPPLPPVLRDQTGDANLEPSNLEDSIGEIEYKGILRCFLVKATGIRNADTGVLGDVSDPFCVLRCGVQEVKSKTIDNSLNPVWHEELMVSWDGEMDIELVLLDKDTFTADDFLGVVTLNPNDFLKKSATGGFTDEEVTIRREFTGKDDQQQSFWSCFHYSLGVVEFRLSFISLS